MRPTYTKTLFPNCLKFKVTWASCTFSDVESIRKFYVTSKHYPGSPLFPPPPPPLRPPQDVCRSPPAGLSAPVLCVQPLQPLQRPLAKESQLTSLTGYAHRWPPSGLPQPEQPAGFAVTSSCDVISPSSPDSAGLHPPGLLSRCLQAARAASGPLQPLGRSLCWARGPRRPHAPAFMALRSVLGRRPPWPPWKIAPSHSPLLPYFLILFLFLALTTPACLSIYTHAPSPEYNCCEKGDCVCFGDCGTASAGTSKVLDK